MNIKEIEFGRLITLRDIMGNVKIAIKASVEDWDDPDEIYNELVRNVDSKLAEIQARPMLRMIDMRIEAKQKEFEELQRKIHKLKKALAYYDTEEKEEDKNDKTTD